MTIKFEMKLFDNENNYEAKVGNEKNILIGMAVGPFYKFTKCLIKEYPKSILQYENLGR